MDESTASSSVRSKMFTFFWISDYTHLYGFLVIILTYFRMDDSITQI